MAEEFLSPIDMLLDENNTDNIKLFNEDNQEVEFEQIALVPINEKTYAILKPANEMEGIGDNEALVFVIEEIDDEECLVIVEDDEIVDKVFEDYYKMLKEEGIDVDAVETTTETTEE
ncbi:MAG: DUF1292 domain-containing protein [Clostridiales bacterium]|nr:DUF1292 domain-containing protein [Clostridiales bacterium]